MIVITLSYLMNFLLRNAETLVRYSPIFFQ